MHRGLCGRWAATDRLSEHDDVKSPGGFHCAHHREALPNLRQEDQKGAVVLQGLWKASGSDVAA